MLLKQLQSGSQCWHVSRPDASSPLLMIITSGYMLCKLQCLAGKFGPLLTWLHWHIQCSLHRRNTCAPENWAFVGLSFFNTVSSYQLYCPHNQKFLTMTGLVSRSCCTWLCADSNCTDIVHRNWDIYTITFTVMSAHVDRCFEHAGADNHIRLRHCAHLNSWLVDLGLLDLAFCLRSQICRHQWADISWVAWHSTRHQWNRWWLLAEVVRLLHWKVSRCQALACTRTCGTLHCGKQALWCKHFVECLCQNLCVIVGARLAIAQSHAKQCVCEMLWDVCTSNYCIVL